MLPRSIATFDAFENAMTLDIAMGGSTNTVLHLLAIAREAGVDFTMKDMDRLSRHVPTLCKVAPSSEYHMEDVHRAGGIAAILGELDRAGLLHGEVGSVHSKTLRDGLKQWDIAQTQRRGSEEILPRRTRRHRHHHRLLAIHAVSGTGCGSRQGLHPRQGACLFAGRRSGGAARQHRAGRLHREDGGRG